MKKLTPAHEELEQIFDAEWPSVTKSPKLINRVDLLGPLFDEAMSVLQELDKPKQGPLGGKEQAGKWKSDDLNV